jgi:uncharacterized repeat protein (TIGR01451 family)
MKRLSMVGLGAIAAFTLIPFSGTPLLLKAFNAGSTTAQNVARHPKVELNLAAEKKVVQLDEKGKEKVSWQALNQGKAIVNPGYVLRYTASGANKGNSPAKNLVITQPIPKGMVYILNSATFASNDGSAVTYSIDNGKTFVAKPTVQVVLPNGKVETRPAPAEAYTHVRWTVGNSLAPDAEVNVAYQVKVR